jgi:hypothetical protein
VKKEDIQEIVVLKRAYPYKEGINEELNLYYTPLILNRIIVYMVARV